MSRELQMSEIWKENFFVCVLKACQLLFSLYCAWMITARPLRVVYLCIFYWEAYWKQKLLIYTVFIPFSTNSAVLLCYHSYNVKTVAVMFLVRCWSVLWRCWLGGRKDIRPVKNWVVGCWRGCLGWGADFAYSPADATATHYLLLQ